MQTHFTNAHGQTIAIADLERDQIESLIYCRDRFKAKAKPKIRDAWMNGDYSWIGWDHAGELQSFRNQHGSFGLQNLVLEDLA